MGKDGTNMFNMEALFKKVDFSIDTSGTFNDVKKQVVAILSKLIENPQLFNLITRIHYSGRNE